MPGVGPVLLASASILAAGEVEPRGPGDWPFRSWIGLFLYLALFLLGLWAIARLGASPVGEEEEGQDDA